MRRDPVVGQNTGRHAGRWSPVKRACVAMSLLLALLGTLRAALKVRPTSFLRTWRCDSSSPCSAAAPSDLGSVSSTASSGCGSRVTDSPTAAWTAQQVVEAFPHDSAPRFLIRGDIVAVPQVDGLHHRYIRCAA